MGYSYWVKLFKTYGWRNALFLQIEQTANFKNMHPEMSVENISLRITMFIDLEETKGIIVSGLIHIFIWQYLVTILTMAWHTFIDDLYCTSNVGLVTWFARDKLHDIYLSYSFQGHKVLEVH